MPTRHNEPQVVYCAIFGIFSASFERKNRQNGTIQHFCAFSQMVRKSTPKMYCAILSVFLSPFEKTTKNGVSCHFWLVLCK